VLSAPTIQRRFWPHSTSLVTTWERLRELRAAGYLTRRVLAYGQEAAYLPTGRAVALTGLALPVPRPQPELTRHFHDMTVADLADWLLSRFPSARWVTEREVRHRLRRAGQRTWPIPDGVLVMAGASTDGEDGSDGGDARQDGATKMAVEVDLTQRDAGTYARKVVAYQALAVSGDYARVQWFARVPGTVRAITRAIGQHGDPGRLRVRLLPSEVSPYGR
jgi:hypothetical protein